jgi:hypothetical protein
VPYPGQAYPPPPPSSFGISVSFPNPINMFVPPPPAVPVNFVSASVIECSRCHGKRGIDVWGKPCTPDNMHFKVFFFFFFFFVVVVLF